LHTVIFLIQTEMNSNNYGLLYVTVVVKIEWSTYKTLGVIIVIYVIVVLVEILKLFSYRFSDESATILSAIE